MEKARDENRKESVHLKKKGRADVLREDLGGALEKDAGQLLKKAPPLDSSGNASHGGEKRSIERKNSTGKAGGKTAAREKDAAIVAQKGMEAGKRAAVHIGQAADAASAKIAGMADDENGSARLAYGTVRDSVRTYQKGLEKTIHAARSMDGFFQRGENRVNISGNVMEGKNSQKVLRQNLQEQKGKNGMVPEENPVSPQALRRKIREEMQSRGEQPAVKDGMAEVPARKGEGTGKVPEKKGTVSAGNKEIIHKKFVEKERMQTAYKEKDARIPDARKKQEQMRSVLGIRQEQAFQKDVEGALSRQHGRLHMQDNERKAEEARISGISNPMHPMARSPAKEMVAEVKLSSGSNLGIQRMKKKKMLQYFGENRKRSRAGVASIKTIGRSLGKTSVKAAGTGAKAGAMASNPGGWILLASAGTACVLLAAFLFFLLIFAVVSGGNSQASSAAPMAKAFSAKVESFRKDVAAEARKYGMEGYTDLFLAVMEVESHGNGNDVFQCSESLGLPRNSLPVDRSIAQGVKYLTACIKQAKVKSPSDIEGIRLAVQGYNFGNGYIPWAVKKDGGWTQENALEFARIQSRGIRRTGDAYIKRAGPWNYGDQYYSDHVLEYYGAADASSPAGECAKVPVKDRMKWLFPEGVPTTQSQMSKYLLQIEVPILNQNGKSTVMKLTVHKKLAGEIKAIFEDMKKAGICTVPSCTAAYNWRKMATNSSKQSYHSYGSVVDWNWTYNPICYSGSAGYRKQPENEFMADKKVVGIWKAHGFYWGGDWKSYHDYMHFTYTNN